MSVVSDTDTETTSIFESIPSVSPPEQNSNDREDENSKSAKGWQAIVKYGTAEHKKMLDDWNDELANLLTFTGLFSAVVTGCIVLTLPMLQDDPTSQSVVLLAQISQQLSSLSVSPQFINSTIQPNGTAVESTPPDPRIVKLNILWTLSLALTVMAAFFTIAVQQWIRRLPLPPHLSVRETVRLWRMRQLAIDHWKVSAIISLLPILVQVAVVFFLVGLYFYLETLHRPTALVLLILSSALLGLFFISALLPLIFDTCPYKSPIILAAVTMIQLCAVPVLGVALLLMMTIGLFVMLFIEAFIRLGFVFVGAVPLCGKKTVTIISDYSVDPGAILVPRERAPHNFSLQMHLQLRHSTFSIRLIDRIGHMAISRIRYIIDSHIPWDLLELRYMAQNSEWLDYSALAVAYSRKARVWLDKPDILYSCLHDIPIAQRAEVGISALNEALISRHRDFSMIYSSRYSPVSFYASQHLPRVLSELEEAVWQILLSARISEGPPQLNAVSLVCLIYRNNVLGRNPDNPPTPSSITQVAKTLVAMRAAQTAAVVIDDPRQQSPTTLLFGCCFHDYILSEEEAQNSISWALDVLNLAKQTTPRGLWQLGQLYTVPLCDFVLGSVATALLGFTSDEMMVAGTAIQRDKLIKLLEGCAFFLTKDAKEISSVTSVIAHLPPDRHIIITAHALGSIAKSVALLTISGVVAEDPGCPSHKVVNSLRNICADAYKDELYVTKQFVDAFDVYVAYELGHGRPTLPQQFRSTDLSQS